MSFAKTPKPPELNSSVNLFWEQLWYPTARNLTQLRTESSLSRTVWLRILLKYCTMPDEAGHRVEQCKDMPQMNRINVVNSDNADIWRRTDIESGSVPVHFSDSCSLSLRIVYHTKSSAYFITMYALCPKRAIGLERGNTLAMDWELIMDPALIERKCSSVGQWNHRCVRRLKNQASRRAVRRIAFPVDVP